MKTIRRRKKTKEETEKEIEKGVEKFAWKCINSIVEQGETLSYCGHCENLKEMDSKYVAKLVYDKLIEFAKKVENGEIKGEELPGSNFYNPSFESEFDKLNEECYSH